MNKLNEIIIKLEEEVYLTEDLESSIHILIDALSISSGNKIYAGSAEIIRRSVNFHNHNLKEILKEVRSLNKNEDDSGKEDI